MDVPGPELEDPFLVCALAGWVDAGFAGSGTIEALVGGLAHCEQIGTIDCSDLLDWQRTRPVARFEEGGLRRIDWPRITFAAGHSGSGRHVVLVYGPETSVRWPSVADEIVGAAQRLGVTAAATVGGMPALVSHRRAVPVLATATSRSLAQESGPLRPDYAGPTGLQTVVQEALGRAGIPCVGLWAQVPQYVSGSPSPAAVRALLTRLVEVAGLDVDLRELDARCDAYLARVEEGLAERPDVRAVVDRLDAETGPPSADDLVSEIERFLRDES